MTRHYHIPLFYTPYYIPYSPISFIYIVHVSCYICHASYYLNSCKSLTISKGREVKNGRNEYNFVSLNPLNAKLKKWPNTLKQFVGNLPTNCLSVFGYFVGLALKALITVKLPLRRLDFVFHRSFSTIKYHFHKVVPSVFSSFKTPCHNQEIFYKTVNYFCKTFRHGYFVGFQIRL